MWGAGNATINADYPWISPTCIESRRSIAKDSTSILNQRYPISGASPVWRSSVWENSIGMYSGCDKLSLQILFVYFLALPTILQLFNFQLFFTLVLYYTYIQQKCSDSRFSSTMFVTNQIAQKEVDKSLIKPTRYLSTYKIFINLEVFINLQMRHVRLQGNQMGRVIRCQVSNFSNSCVTTSMLQEESFLYLGREILLQQMTKTVLIFL